MSGHFSAETKSYGPDGTLCGTTHMEGDSGSSGMSNFKYTLTDANGHTWEIDVDTNTGDMDIKCSDGTVLHFSRAEMQAYRSCMGQDTSEKCEIDKGNGNGQGGYNLCTSDKDCDSGQKCCIDPSQSQGVCLPSGVCPY
jgi:hypothetical protein